SSVCHLTTAASFCSFLSCFCLHRAPGLRSSRAWRTAAYVAWFTMLQELLYLEWTYMLATWRQVSRATHKRTNLGNSICLCFLLEAMKLKRWLRVSPPLNNRRLELSLTRPAT